MNHKYKILSGLIIILAILINLTWLKTIAIILVGWEVFDSSFKEARHYIFRARIKNSTKK